MEEKCGHDESNPELTPTVQDHDHKQTKQVQRKEMDSVSEIAALEAAA